MEGVRYGLWIGLFTSVPMAFNLYSVLPVPVSLALQWFIYGTLQSILCGTMLAVAYKPTKATISEVPPPAEASPKSGE